MLRIFHSRHIRSIHTVCEVLQKGEDLEQRIEAPVSVNIYTLEQFKQSFEVQSLKGVCIDDLDIACSVYLVTRLFSL